MLSTVNLDKYNFSKAQVTEMVRYMEASEKEIAEFKKAESYPLMPKMKKKKKSERKKLRKQISKVLSNTSMRSTLSKGSGLDMICSITCCCGRKTKHKTKEEEIAISLWTKQHCRNREEFFNLMVLSTKNFRVALQGLRAIKHLLEYKDDPSAEAQGLSQVGGSIWLLTFAVQHLLDPEHSLTSMTTEMIRIRAVYQDIGNYSQQFVNMMEGFFVKIDEMRENCISIIKTLQSHYKLVENPFDLRPEIHPRKLHVKRRVGYGFEDPGDADEEEPGTFQVHWTPLNIMYKADGDQSWESFGDIKIEKKLTIFKEFTISLLGFVTTVMEEFIRATHPITNIFVASNRSQKVQSTIYEITSAMFNFIRDDNPAEKGQGPDDIELDRWGAMIEEFWIGIDYLYDVTYDLTLLIQESRDIVRTCYVYATNFYHWKMSDFDDFDPLTKTKAYKRDLKKVHVFIAKVMGHRRYSDAALFLSFADFSSSPYQEIVKQHQVVSEGMRLKLELWGDEPSETWGLVGERDNRDHRRH